MILAYLVVLTISNLLWRSVVVVKGKRGGAEGGLCADEANGEVLCHQVAALEQHDQVHLHQRKVFVSTHCSLACACVCVCERERAYDVPRIRS
jgi:catabolite regulation protein CreA